MSAFKESLVADDFNLGYFPGELCQKWLEALDLSPMTQVAFSTQIKEP